MSRPKSGFDPATGYTSVTPPNTQPNPAVRGGNPARSIRCLPRHSQPCTAGRFDVFGLLGVGTDVYHLDTRFYIPRSRLPQDPDISGPRPFSSPQIPPSKGRVGNHTEITMYEALDQLWSPSPPYPLSCRSESARRAHDAPHGVQYSGGHTSRTRPTPGPAHPAARGRASPSSRRRWRRSGFV